MLLSLPEVARRVGVHPSTVRRWLREDLSFPRPAPLREVGGGCRWRESDVECWAARRGPRTELSAQA
jgi:predicted DNA-binding transcriptional regulator AlpA